MESFGGPYYADEIDDLVSDEPDFHSDQPLMYIYAFATDCSRPKSRITSMNLLICLSDHIDTHLFPMNPCMCRNN